MPHVAIRNAVLVFTSLMLAACGGGGGGGTGSTSTSAPLSSGSGSGAAFNVNALAAFPTLAAVCAAPRTGTDPVTGQPYPDRQGTLLNEQDWLAAWTNDTYLWEADLSPFPNPGGYTTALDYFNALRTPVTTASGARKDKFHFTYATATWEQLAQSNTSPGYGATFELIATKPPRQALVAYVDAGSPAATLIPPLGRGAQVLKVDGVDLVNDATTSGVNTLNAGLFPASIGETHTFVVQDLGAATPRTITLTAVNQTSPPVPTVSVLTGGVGYILFNDHTASAEAALASAINQLKAAHVSDLVLDLRYNGGGYLDIAAELAYMIAGPTVTAGKTFDRESWNAKHPVTDPYGQTITPTLFPSTTQFSTTPGTALPYLGLSRVFVLTGPGTCSASEAVVNGLRGVDVQVIQIGSTTCGKPYGFLPADNCGTTYFTIQFQGTNAQGFGNYPDGFVPQNGLTTGIDPSAILPGCAVADDYSHALGDPNETRLSVALAYRTALASSAAPSCPVPSGLSVTPALQGVDDPAAPRIANPRALMNGWRRVH